MAQFYRTTHMDHFKRPELQRNANILLTPRAPQMGASSGSTSLEQRMANLEMQMSKLSGAQRPSPAQQPSYSAQQQPSYSTQQQQPSYSARSMPQQSQTQQTQQPGCMSARGAPSLLKGLKGTQSRTMATSGEMVLNKAQPVPPPVKKVSLASQSQIQPLYKKRTAATLGIVRLDYDYPPAPGDIDSPESFTYDVFYRVVPGLTFEMCQEGKMTPNVEREFADAIEWLCARGVNGITGDCGFMMYFQQFARGITSKPVFMSSLAQLPAITCAFNKNEMIAILTANDQTLMPMSDLIKHECGVNPEEDRFLIVGCQDVPGFEAVAYGEKVDTVKVQPGIVAKCINLLREYPNIRAFLMECTELPPYSDAVRAATGLPVFDAITCCDYFVAGSRDNKRFGLNDWMEDWDGAQDDYQFGDNLSKQEQAHLVNKIKPKNR
eukprot:CAMPEP_0170623766 /NCGR_PEP_ID=MMETSP0224-20130122/29874_1 /TAXON_ID=285029 /ORGANISM="Togula jolla, Strain CCCM 725" /LENGTH=435 /DNA_ID=CAMNT_0010950243 /DNA_START=34 /DNA_END=1341 /DNA_ORIENTATION=+